MLVRDAACGTPTTHYINTSVKLTIVTNLSFSERIAIATLSYSFTICERNSYSCQKSKLFASSGAGEVPMKTSDVCLYI